jgi:sigma-B regulation protein RsbU (phosphoserine phosphatase)
MEYPSQPELVLEAVNKRIIEDTNTKQFVTAFYGILDPENGRLTYCNAGHCPPYLINLENDNNPGQLIRTGVPLGIFEDQYWKRRIVNLNPCDVLVFYTDGITEAQNEDQILFGEDRLVEAVRQRLGKPAVEIKDGVINDLHLFMGNVPQTDDIILSILLREPS